MSTKTQQNCFRNTPFRLEPNTFAREGYRFAGWSTDWRSAQAEYSDEDTATFDGDRNLYAIWALNTYTATFDAAGGEGGTAKTQEYGTPLAAPTVTREGYTFASWDPAVPDTMPAEDTTYTAQWTMTEPDAPNS